MNRAEEILEHFAIETPDEIDLEAICHYFGAQIQRQPLSGCEGRLIGFKNKAIITVNSNSSLSRQNFTAAHELGHWLNDKGKVSHQCTEEVLLKAWSGDNIETIANKFAAKLLMPENILRARIKKLAFRIKDVQELANDFSVSLTAMAIRVLKLDLATGVLLWSNGEYRNRFTISQSYPTKAWPVKKIDNESCAKYLQGKSIGSKFGTSVPADLWIDRTDASFHEVYEDSIVVSENSILTLLHWPDESYLIKLLEN